MAIAPDQLGIGIRRNFTTAGVHPYDTVTWERRDARISNFRDGTVAFEQLGVEVPSTWSLNATNILAQKYFRGTLGTPERETSLKQVVDRIVDTITAWGTKDGYFVDDDEAATFSDELKYLLIHQQAAFNSPVWFNIGVADTPQQGSACFILSVDDQMKSILNWYAEEGVIFQGGSGAGVNISKIRSSKEYLKGGGTASGPVSFMRGADASAGTIKCLRHDTLIATDGGVVPIRDVRAGSQVMTRFGWRHVSAVHDNGVRPLVKVTTALGDEIVCTPEHRFLVRTPNGEVWKEAGDLGPLDHVVVDLDGSGYGSPQPLVHPGPGHFNEIVHDLPTTIDEPFALWLGWVWGDGSVTSRPGAKFVAMQIGDADPELASRYTVMVEGIFGKDAHVFTNRSPGRSDQSMSVRIASSMLLRFLERNGLWKGKAGDLRVPAAIASSPATVRAAFLAGLFEADGHVGNGYPTLSTISEGLALDVHRLLLSIGIPSTMGVIADRRTAYGDNPVHIVRVVGGEGVRRFAKLVGFVSERKSTALDAACARKSASPFETAWHLPHVAAELDDVWRSTNDQRLRRAIAPYCRYVSPRRMSLLRARALIERFPELQATSLGRFAEGAVFYQPVRVETAEPAATFDLTVDGVHEYLVDGVVTHNSGGKTRRAAKMVILNVDHPDIRDFIWCKAIEERKARVLRDNGFDMDLDGKDSHSIQYQNANNSVRVTDEFMQAVVDGTDWQLKAVTTGEVLETIPARELFRELCEATWQCADPGMQFDTTINKWHTAHATGRINGSNPCSEYMHLDNSACNLASLNLLSFLSDDDVFDVDGFVAATATVFTAQEIIVGNADYPTAKIAKTSRRFRQLGIGYANLGALLMANGLAYDSDGGRAWAAALTALLTGTSYATSARTAARMGPFAGYQENREHMLRVLGMHRDEAAHINEELVPTEILSAAQEAWDDAVRLGTAHGVRNSQASVLAPTGTIGLLMDCDTTGIEPDLGLVKMKKLVGGGNMAIVNQTVPRALKNLGYSPAEVDSIIAYIDEHKSILGAPDLKPEHLEVFACSMGDNTIHYLGHVKMMAAVQPFISGAISKTVNMPEDVSVEDVEDLHLEAWRLGLKAVAIYRDNCKVAQPLATAKKGDKGEPDPSTASSTGVPSTGEGMAVDAALAKKVAELEAQLERHTVIVKQPVRERLPRQRRSRTFAFRVADCEGYATVGEYDDGRAGELFIKVSKQGSTLNGLMDAFAISVSLGLQHGVPLSTYIKKYTNTRFEPAGMTDDPELRIATSLMDYIFRRMALHYLTYEERSELSIFTTNERIQPTLPGVEEASVVDHGVVGADAPHVVDVTDAASTVVPAVAEPPKPVAATSAQAESTAPLCYSCGNEMQRAGSCYVCGSCGSTSGCS